MKRAKKEPSFPLWQLRQDFQIQGATRYTVNVLYLSVYDILCFLDFRPFCVDLIKWLNCIHFNIQTLINDHLAVYLIWRRDSTAKGAQKNTSPNVICLQYYIDNFKALTFKLLYQFLRFLS